MKQPPPVQIALNVAIDGALAAVAVPLARAIADPSAQWLDPHWLPAAGAAALLLAGLPVRLPWQYWRFAGIDDLLGVVWASIGGSALLSVAMAWAGVSAGNPAFPVVYGLALLALLGAPRVGYRLWRHRRGGVSLRATHPERRPLWWWARPRTSTCSCARWPGTGGSCCRSRACSQWVRARQAGGFTMPHFFDLGRRPRLSLIV